MYANPDVRFRDSALTEQEAQLSLTNRARCFVKLSRYCKTLSENVDKKFTTDYNVA